MNTQIKGLEEKIGEKRAAITKIQTTTENESRTRTEEEKVEWKQLLSDIDNLSDEVRDLKDLEADKKIQAKVASEARKVAGGEVVDGEDKELQKINREFPMADYFNTIVRGTQPTGLVAEMNDLAQEECRAFGTGLNGVGIPSAMLKAAEKRATISQTVSAIQPTAVGGYVEGLRDYSLATAVGVDIIEGLTADFKVPIVGANSVAFATAENAAAADGGAVFTSFTLSPNRITGYFDISNRVLLQNGNSALESVMRDVGRATAERIDLSMFPTTSLTNSPTSIAATSGVGTFTETATHIASSTVLKDMITAEQELADNKALNASGRVAYVCATNLIYDIKTAPQVASVNPGAENAVFGRAMVNGYPCYFHTAVTKSGGTSGDFIFGDFSFVKMGFFGGLDIVRDPYSQLLNDETRLVLHRHMDFGVGQGGAFIKATSLVA